MPKNRSAGIHEPVGYRRRKLPEQPNAISHRAPKVYRISPTPPDRLSQASTGVPHSTINTHWGSYSFTNMRIQSRKLSMGSKLSIRNPLTRGRIIENSTIAGICVTGIPPTGPDHAAARIQRLRAARAARDLRSESIAAQENLRTIHHDTTGARSFRAGVRPRMGAASCTPNTRRSRPRRERGGTCVSTVVAYR